MKGAQAVVECLVSEGVDTIFGYPGGMILPLYDALRGDKRIKNILTTHEQDAAHAADGYARASGRVGVCIATSGPGATNLVTGIATAYMDSIPLVAITGQVDAQLLGRDAFQETDIVGITMPITKQNYKVKDPKKLMDTLREAFEIARGGRPGPVLIDIPRNVFNAEVEYVHKAAQKKKLKQPDVDFLICVAEAEDVMLAAKRPIVIAGGGIISANASHDFIKFIEKYHFPVATTLMGIGSVPYSHPQLLGFAGMHGKKAANNAIAAADLIIAIGSRFADRQTGSLDKYTKNTKFIHIDIDPAEIDKNIASAIGLAGDMKTILRLLMKREAQTSLDGWWSRIENWRDEYAYDYSVNRLTLPWALHHVAAVTSGKKFAFSTDVGQHQMWAALHLHIDTPRTWLTSGGLGTMGFGLPAAMGAQLYYGDSRRVIHIAGDGGIKMTGSEYYTIARLNLPIISLIVNNKSLGMIRQLQKVNYGERYTACEFDYDMDYVAYAESFGIAAEVVSTPDGFVDAFDNAMNARGPYVIVLDIHRSFVEPMTKGGARINEFVDFK
ncbi:MAG: biosynthetic-type acetolactate synthase large subunit [Schwartzia sp.]|nr:biosynthetic-type acetolactate synthase large subunit [Schwartzia sp. (in: firmicutes)]